MTTTSQNCALKAKCDKNVKKKIKLAAKNTTKIDPSKELNFKVQEKQN